MSLEGGQQGRGRESVRCGEAGLRLVPSAKSQLCFLLHPEQTLHSGRLLDGIHEYLELSMNIQCTISYESEYAQNIVDGASAPLLTRMALQRLADGAA